MSTPTGSERGSDGKNDAPRARNDVADFSDSADGANLRSRPAELSAGPASVTVLVVAGLAFEAAAVQGVEGVRVLHGLGAAARAADIAAAAADAVGIVSFGTAGALSPDLRPGDCVLARSVLESAFEPALGSTATPPRRHDTDPRWLQQLTAALPAARCVDFFAAADPVVTAADKSTLFARTGAAAVDMESGHLARLAASLGLPFVVCRIIIDRADHTLPHAALAGMAANGETRILPVVLSLARAPQQLPSLLRLARDAWTARQALSATARQVPPRFGFDRRA